MDITSRVLVNGRLATLIRVKSGVWYSCPLFLILFICVMELLAQWLRRDSRMQGIQVPG